MCLQLASDEIEVALGIAILALGTQDFPKFDNRAYGQFQASQ